MEYKLFQELIGSLKQAVRIARGEFVDGARITAYTMTIGQRIKKGDIIVYVPIPLKAIGTNPIAYTESAL